VLVLASSLVLILIACGGGNNESNGPEIADLCGGEADKEFFPETNLPETKSPKHNQLRSFVPTDKGLKRDSAVYGNWNPGKGTFEQMPEAKATIPAVNVQYESHGFELVGNVDDKERAEQKHTQRCTLTIFSCPEKASATSAMKDLMARVLGNGFEDKGEMQLSGSDKDASKIKRYRRQDDGEVKSILSIYIQQIDQFVIYAIESEVDTPLIDKDGNKIERPTTGQLGNSYGATILVRASMRIRASN
jgi:hypothetical protein